MKRRAHNEGTIYQREDGLWVAQVTLPNGKRKTKYAKTQKLVREWLQEQKETIKDNLWLETEKITLNEFIDRYMADVATHTLRERTYDSYDCVIRNHLRPELGEIKLTQLRPEHLQTLYSQKLNQGLSRRTVQYTHAVLHKMLSQAVKWGLVMRNVCDLVNPPTPKKSPPNVLNADQIRILLEAVKGDRLYPLYVTAVSTGMRVSELLGMMWEDVDLDHGMIHVKRAIQLMPGKGLVLTEPKSDKSRRSIKLSPFALGVLKTHRKGSISQFVFSTRNQTPFSSRNILRHFRKTLESAGLPKIRFHDLRHTFASFLLNQNIHPKVVQEMLGHSTITLTLDTYSHLLPDMQDEAAGKMDALLQN